MLVGSGWLVDHYFHTGWVLGICLRSVFDHEASWIRESHK